MIDEVNGCDTQDRDKTTEQVLGDTLMENARLRMDIVRLRRLNHSLGQEMDKAHTMLNDIRIEMAARDSQRLEDLKVTFAKADARGLELILSADTIDFLLRLASR